MEELVTSPAFKVFAAVSAVLVLKMVGLAYLIGGLRGFHKRFPNPEDAKLFKGEEAPEHDLVARVKRAHMNSIENEPLFIVLGLLWVMVGAPTSAIQIYAYTFLGFRLAHSAAYILKLQPWRTLSYTVASLCLIGMATQILMVVFGG